MRLTAVFFPLSPAARFTLFPARYSVPRKGKKGITSEALFADKTRGLRADLTERQPRARCGRHLHGSLVQRSAAYHHTHGSLVQRELSAKGRLRDCLFGFRFAISKSGFLIPSGASHHPPFVRKGRREERGAALPCHRQGQKEQPGTSYRERVKRQGRKAKTQV